MFGSDEHIYLNCSQKSIKLSPVFIHILPLNCMKKVYLPGIVLIIFMFSDIITPALIAQERSVMTYNIRYGSADDGADSWDHRKENLAHEMAFYEPDFIGVQEALHFQLEYLDSLLTSYSYIGVGRDDGKEKGEYSAIFYHTERVRLLDNGTFWLSETPDQISKGWDAALPRICTYGYFQYKKRKKDKIWYFNTHFDHRGEIARVNSVDLIIQKVRELADLSEAVVISGDFNLPPKSEAIRKMSAAFNDTYTTSDHPPMGPTTTFTSFDINKEGGNRIDYIFTNDKIQTSKTAILSHWIDGHFNSDHFPVLSYFDIK